MRLFYHKMEPLCVALWADNNVVVTLANCCSPTLLRAGDGVDRRKRGNDGVREQDPTPVKIPLQTKKYVKTFGKIDNKNMKDAQFDLRGISKKHNWSPNINKRYYNMHGGNAGTFYERACALFTPEARVLGPKERMADLAHYLCKLGKPTHSYVPCHPAILRDLPQVYNSAVGRKI